MAKNLLILGAGQFGQMAREIAESMNQFKKIDFLDDNSELAIGCLESYREQVQNYGFAIVAIGNPKLRLHWLEKLEHAGYQIPSLVAPTAYVAPSARLMKGTIIEPNATVQAHATVSVGCIVSSGAVLRHNAVLEDGCHIDCNSVVMSGIVVPSQTKVPILTIYKALE